MSQENENTQLNEEEPVMESENLEVDQEFSASENGENLDGEGSEPEQGSMSSDDLSKAKQEIQELKDSWMRERAEFANYKKRTAQEQIRLKNNVVGNFVKNLLPVLDNLERVLQADSTDPAVKNFVIGVEMIQTEFQGVLEREGIKPEKPEGEAFDPISMEAIAMEDVEGLEKETVLEVYQAGYFINLDGGEKQVLRPARVKVGKPA